MGDIISSVRELIKIRSNADEKETYEEIIFYIFQMLTRMGIESEIVVCPKGYEYVDLEHNRQKSIADKYSLIANIKKGNYKNGEHLVLYSHVDTMKMQDRVWLPESEEGQIKNGRIYGRGASDSKSGIAIILSALQWFKENVRDGEITAVFTGDQENGGYCGAGYVADFIRGNVLLATNGKNDQLGAGYSGRSCIRVRQMTAEDYEWLLQHISYIEYELQMMGVIGKVHSLKYTKSEMQIMVDTILVHKSREEILAYLKKSTMFKECDLLYSVQGGRNKSDRYAGLYNKVMEKEYANRKFSIGNWGDSRFFEGRVQEILYHGVARENLNIFQQNEWAEIGDIKRCEQTINRYMRALYA